MKSYVYHMRAPLESNVDGWAGGTVAMHGYYVYLTNDGELVDIAGPFDDEYDAEMAARRAEEWSS